MIECGLHSYINCVLYPHRFSNYIDLYTHSGYMDSMSLSTESLFLGKFIIPKGATYCLNRNGEVVSDVLVYTGKYVELKPYKQYNTKKLWKEK